MSVMRRCVCCNKEYEYCPGCHKKDQPGWMVTFCSLPCKELFNLVSAYNTKRIGKDVVKKYAMEHGLDSSKFSEPVKKVLDDVMDVEIKSVELTEQPIKTPIMLNNMESVKNEPLRKEHRIRRSKRHAKRQFGY